MLLRKGEVKPWGDKGGLRPPLAECGNYKNKTHEDNNTFKR